MHAERSIPIEVNSQISQYGNRLKQSIVDLLLLLVYESNRMTLKINRETEAETAYEYGCDLRRLYPWKEVADPVYWGAAIGSVRAGETTTPHDHDEEETFVIFSGQGTITVNGESSGVAAGDVIYLPRASRHMLKNSSPTEPLRFLTIYWGSPEAIEAMRPIVQRSHAAPNTADSIEREANPTHT